jgi:hypothetical protein
MLLETQISGGELETVRKKLPLLLERDDTWFSQVEKKDVEQVSARDMRVPLELRPGGNFGYFDPDGGDLGQGDGPTISAATINTVHMKLGVQWTKKAEWATDSERKSIVSTFKHLVATGMKEFRRQLDSQCLTGGDGVIGTISAVATGGGNDTYTLGSDGFGVRLIRFGQSINVYNAALSTNRTAGAERKISSYDLVNKQIVVPSVAGAIATDKIVTGGLSATPSVGLFGLPYHHSNASTGTWLGFNRATTPEVRANRVNAAGGLALPFARLAINKIGDRVGMDTQVQVEAWMHPCQKQAYEQLGQLVSLIQKQPKDEALDLFFGDNMQLAGAPIRTHFSWDKTRIDFVAKNLWGRAEMHSADFYDVGGRRYFESRGPSGGVATSQIFYLSASFNLFHANPAAASYIDGLTVPSGY